MENTVSASEKMQAQVLKTLMADSKMGMAKRDKPMRKVSFIIGPDDEKSKNTPKDIKSCPDKNLADFLKAVTPIHTVHAAETVVKAVHEATAEVLNNEQWEKKQAEKLDDDFEIVNEVDVVEDFDVIDTKEACEKYVIINLKTSRNVNIGGKLANKT